MALKGESLACHVSSAWRCLSALLASTRLVWRMQNQLGDKPALSWHLRGSCKAKCSASADEDR